MSDAMTTGETVPALKERAGVVNALIDGAQTVLVRHPTLDPGTIDGRFVLYPAYSHQEPARYQSKHEDYYHCASTKPDAGIPIRAVATVREEYTVSPEDLNALARHYVYTPDGLRDKYGSDGGENEDDADRTEDANENADADDATADDFRVLLLRVGRLESPKLIAERDGYRGCRAWIELDDAVDVDLTSVTPVLDEATFAERRAAIRAALE